MFSFKKKLEMPSAAEALPGRPTPIPTAREHFVLHTPLKGPYPDGFETAIFGMGCFWGAERKFWELGEGIHSTAVGYAGGHTPNPTYEEVCSGRTGHNEVVQVVYDPKKISYEKLLKTFWENHDPTQGMRQGNDVGTQYRSGIYVSTPAQRKAAEASKAMYEKELKARRFNAVTTEILDAPPFYLGLAFCLLLLLFHFGVQVYEFVVKLPRAHETDVILGILSLIDLVFTGNLVLIVVMSGYENFVSRIETSDHDRPYWMATVDFGGLKHKLITSIVAISAIQLLRAFMNIEQY